MQKEQINSRITVGKTVFKCTVNKKLINSKEIVRILNDHDLHISGRNYQILNGKNLFEQMIQCSFQRVNLYWNHNLQILKQIQHVDFTMIVRLILYGNNIENVQSLLFISFNSLELLHIYCNCISRITCLNKLSTPSLTQLQIYQNPITQVKSLEKAKMNQNHFDLLALQFQKIDFIIGQDLSLITKLNTNSIGRVRKFYDICRCQIKQKNISAKNLSHTTVEIPIYMHQTCKAQNNEECEMILDKSKY